MAKIIDLDRAEEQDIVLILSHLGVRNALTIDRLKQLLQREQDILENLARQGASTPEPSPSPPPGPPGDDGRPTFTHASLSARIKKMHAHAKPRKRLRPAYRDFLRELIAGFDWRIPEHPNTKLEHHLVEMMSWPEEPQELRKEVMAFLERYLQARRRGG